MRKLLIATIVLALASISAVYIYRFATAAQLHISLEPALPPDAVAVTVDGERVYPSGENGQLYKANVGAGEHEVLVVSKGFRDFESSVSTNWREEKPVVASLQKRSVAETAEMVATENYDSNDGVVVLRPRFFGNEDWLVYVAADSSGASDGSLVVARFSAEKRKWEIVAEGSDIDDESAVLHDAPQDLISYLRNGQ